MQFYSNILKVPPVIFYACICGVKSAPVMLDKKLNN